MKYTPEQLLQIDCVNFTRIMCPSVLLIASMNGMYLGAMRNPEAYIAKMKKLGMRGGDLDLRLHWKSALHGSKTIFVPVTAYVELKAGKGRPTNDQITVMAELDNIGIPNMWVNTIEDYITVLKRFGVPMRTGIYAGIHI